MPNHKDKEGAVMLDASLIDLATLEIDSKIGKDRHFIAADRKNRWRIWLGLVAVIGSAVLSSGIGAAIRVYVLSSFKSANTDDLSRALDVLAHVLPLLVGISTAVLGFLGLEKQVTQHRFVGNAYIQIAREARFLINSIAAGETNKFADERKDLLRRYLEINQEGESCPTNNRDSKKAMAMNDSRRAAIKQKVAELDSSALDIGGPQKSKKMTIRRALWRKVKYCLMATLSRIGLVRKTDFRRYLRAFS